MVKVRLSPEEVREHKKIYNREYYLRNREKIAVQVRQYYQKNGDAVRAQSKLYYRRRKESAPHLIKKSARKSYFRGRENKLVWHKENYKSKRIAFLTELGGCVCAFCGFSDWRALQVDHVNGNGAEERRTNKKYTSTANWKNILKHRKDYQVLCANCNFIKRYENKESRNKGEIPSDL